MVHTFEDDFYEKHRTEAIAMERLTFSPHVIDVYAFCGQSILSELADGTSLGKLSDKSSRFERLKIALDVAEGLADVHGIDGIDNTTLVHFDINPGNVISIHGTLKLNDFNVAKLLKWNTKTKSTCGFPHHFPNPQWRSPEEALEMDNLTEKVDVYSMGNIFYRLIAGKSPWGKLDNNPTKDEINAMVKSGKIPHLPAKVTDTTDPCIIAIREAMLGCFRFDPSKRPSARSIAKGLRKAYEEILRDYKLEKHEVGHHKPGPHNKHTQKVRRVQSKSDNTRAQKSRRIQNKKNIKRL